MDQARRILVELDAIIDTRLGTLAKLGVDPAIIFNQDLVYWARLADDFEAITGGVVTRVQYKTAYESRDIETLKRSMITNAVDDLSFSTRYNTGLLNTGEAIREVTVTVNYYPYLLSDEQVKIYLEGLREYIALDANIEAVSIPPNLLGLEDLVGRWDAYMVYNFRDWLAANENHLLSRKAAEFEFILPGIWFTYKLPEEADMKDREGNVMDAFSMMQAAFVGTAKLDIEPVAVFSAAHPLGADGIIKKLTGGSGQDDTKSS